MECSDAEIFLTIPYLLVLKSSLDKGNEAQIATGVCQRFFPSMFTEPESQDPQAGYYKFKQLKEDLSQLREEAGSSFFESRAEPTELKQWPRRNCCTHA